MMKLQARSREIMIGIVAASLPLLALAYRFGFNKAVAMSLVVFAAWMSAKLAITLFGRRSRLAKGAAIAMQANLLFLFFMPEPLKEKMRELQAKERRP